MAAYMKFRYLLILLTGALLLSSAAHAEPASATRGQRDLARSDQRPRHVRVARHVLGKHFGDDRFDLHESDNFVMLHDTTSHRAAARVALLEHTYDRFFEAFKTFDGLRPVHRPLVCVVFAKRHDFVTYARRVDWLDMSWSGGYYSARTNRMALYDARRAGNEPENQTQPQSDGQKKAADDGQRPTVLLSSTDEAGASASPPLNVGAITHEAAHQLAFNSGLQRGGVMYPLWLSEGLACAFETNHAGQPFGIERINRTRLFELRRAMRGDGLIPLRRFITMTRPPTDDAQKLNAVYAQAWALFRFLFEHDREALSDYMRDLARERRGHRTRIELRREFTRAFGAIDELARKWRAHVETLR